MFTWTELRSFDYSPPEGLPPLPTRPRDAWRATAADGAQLDAFRWGSPLTGAPMVLELRRHGAPRCSRVRDAHGPGIIDADSPCPCCGRAWDEHGADLGEAYAPRLEEVQRALDQLAPPGGLFMLGLASNGADASYPEGLRYCAVRLLQTGQLNPGLRS